MRWRSAADEQLGQIWGAEQSPSAASGLRLRPRDLANIGSLLLNDGKWRGRQIIPTEWINLSVERRVATMPWFPEGHYGYGFMRYPATVSGHRVIAAFGNGDQGLFVLPDLRLAVTVLAGNYNAWDIRSSRRVLDRIVAAMEEDAHFSAK